MLKVAVLISGRGSNLQALIDAASRPDYPAEIIAVISNKEDAEGLKKAENAGIPTHTLNHRGFTTRAEFDAALSALIKSTGAEFICLAGFMRLLTPDFVNEWQNRIINIHPSLLPDFKGATAHEDVIKAGVNKSGCTVHFVTAEMDSGPIILQKEVPVLPGDTPETLAARVLIAEHEIYPAALKIIAEK